MGSPNHLRPVQEQAASRTFLLALMVWPLSSFAPRGGVASRGPGLWEGLGFRSLGGSGRHQLQAWHPHEGAGSTVEALLPTEEESPASLPPHRGACPPRRCPDTWTGMQRGTSLGTRGRK